MADRSERLQETLRAARRAVTPQRVRVWDALHAERDHPTAAELHARCPELPLATIYNTLDLFADLELVRPFAVDGTTRYDIDPTEHVNVICTHCGRVADVMVELPPEMGEGVGAASGYRLSHPRINWYGVCATCQSNLSA